MFNLENLSFGRTSVFLNMNYSSEYLTLFYLLTDLYIYLKYAFKEHMCKYKKGKIFL